MLRNRKTGTAAIRRWRTGRAAPQRRVAGSETGTFAEDLALFERQVRDEALRGPGSAGEAPSGPPAAAAA